MQTINDNKNQVGDSVKSNSLVFGSLKRYTNSEEKRIRLSRIKCNDLN